MEPASKRRKVASQEAPTSPSVEAEAEHILASGALYIYFAMKLGRKQHSLCSNFLELLRNLLFTHMVPSTFCAGAHPYGVKPWGNFYFDGIKREDVEKVRADGLGLFSVLEDELIMEVFVYFDCPRSMAFLGAASKIMWAFASEEEIWKEFCLNEFEGTWKFDHDWRRTYIARSTPQFMFPSPAGTVPFKPQVCTCSHVASPRLNVAH